jgi:hypothetical protein
VYCVRGPYQHAADDRGRASTSRLACLSYTCSSCGPHVIVVLQAAAEVVVERIVNWRMPARSDTWFGCVAEDLPQSAARALQRWAATEDDDAVGVSAPEPSREWRLHNERPPERMYVTIAQSPKLTSTLVMWHGTGNAPTGALARHLEDGRPVAASDLSATTGEMVAAVDREAWALADARATVLRGSTFLNERIADLRDRVLGRARARRQKTRPMTFAVRSYRDGERVRRELANRLQVGMKLDGMRIEPMKRKLVEHWSAEIDGASPSVRREMERMKGEGWFEANDPVEVPSVAEVGVLDDLLGKHLTAPVEDDRVLRVGRKLGLAVVTPRSVQQVAQHLLAEHVYAGMADCCGPNPPIARRVNGVPVGGSVVGAEAVNQLANEMSDLDHPLGRLPVADDHVLVEVLDLAPGMSVRRVQAAIMYLTEVHDRAFAA